MFSICLQDEVFISLTLIVLETVDDIFFLSWNHFLIWNGETLSIKPSWVSLIAIFTHKAKCIPEPYRVAAKCFYIITNGFENRLAFRNSPDLNLLVSILVSLKLPCNSFYCWPGRISLHSNPDFLHLKKSKYSRRWMLIIWWCTEMHGRGFQ